MISFVFFFGEGMIFTSGLVRGGIDFWFGPVTFIELEQGKG